MMPTLSKLTFGIFGNKEPEPTFSDVQEVSEIYFATPSFCTWASPDDLCVEVKMLSLRAQRTDEHKWDMTVECWANHKVSLVNRSNSTGIGGTIFAPDIKPFIPELEEAGYKAVNAPRLAYRKENVETAALFKEIRDLNFTLTKDDKAVQMQPHHYADIGQEFPGIRACEAEKLYRQFKNKLKTQKMTPS